MKKVITYQSSRGATINLTRSQVTMLEHAEQWPTDHYGFEYAQVSHGLHAGRPSFTDEQIAAFLARGTPLEPRADDDANAMLH